MTTGLLDEISSMLSHVCERHGHRARNAPEALITMLQTFDREGHYWRAISPEVRTSLIVWLADCVNADDADEIVTQLVKHDYDLESSCDRLRQRGLIA